MQSLGLPQQLRSRVFPPGRSSLTLAVVIAVLFYIFPAIMIIYGAFRTSAPGLPGSWSLAGLSAGYTDPRTWVTLGHSVLVALLAGVPATALAVMFAWIVSRTNAMLRHAVTPVMLVALAMPPLFFSLSWALLGAPHVGLLNHAAASLGLSSRFIDIKGLAGIAFVLGLKICPLAYFMMIGPFMAMDRRLEEASAVSGAGRFTTSLRVNLPMMAPAISGALLIALVIGLIAFEVPLLIGTPSGYYVFSTQIYDYITSNVPPNYAGASALAILLIAIVLFLVAVKWRLIGQHDFTTVGGKGADTGGWDVRRWAWVCNAAVVVFAVLTVLLPTAQLVIGSLEPLFGVMGRYSLHNYQAILNNPILTPALTNSLVLAVVGGALAVGVSSGFALVGRHGRIGAQRFLELATWLPWATYGILLSLGLSWAFLTIPFLRQLFGTVWILLIGFVIAMTPLTSRTVEAGLAQVGVELEEASRVSGASQLRTSAGIVMRLMILSLLAAWFIGAIHIVGNLEVPILLSTPSNPTVAVQVFQLYQNGETSVAAALFCFVLFVITIAGVVGWYGTRAIVAMQTRRAHRRESSSTHRGYSGPDASRSTGAVKPT